MCRRGRTVVISLFFGVLTALCHVGELSAQGATSSYSVRVTPARISFASPGTLEFNLGRAEFTSVEIQIEREGPGAGGPPWVLEVRADESSLGGGGKPASDLLIRRPAGGWTSLTTSFQKFAEGRGPATVTTDLRIRLSYGEDSPDLYGTDLTFRVSKP